MSDSPDRIAGLSPQKRALLAKLLREKNRDTASLPPIPRRAGRETAALSFAQQRLWFLSQLEPDHPFYNVPTVVRLAGPLDSAALQHALNTLVQRHESLRTTFTIAAGRPCQQIAAMLAIALPLVELPGASDEQIRELAGEEIRRPFDLAQGPLLRARLLRIRQDDHVLVLTMHHIVSDGWSMKILIRELLALFKAFASGRPVSMPALSIQYADYAEWQQQWLRGPAVAEQLSYWRQQLADLPTVQLPSDHPRPQIQTFRGARHTVELPQPLTAELAALAQREGSTMFMVLLAAFQTLLSRYSHQDDIVVGSPVAGRNRVEIEGLIGCFINTLVLRSDLAGQPTFRELLQRVRQVCLGAYAHQDLPFEQLVEALQPRRDLSRQPLFQVMFILQDSLPTAEVDLDLGLRLIAVDAGTAQFDLTLSLIQSSKGIDGVLEYNSDLFAPGTVARIAGHFETLLAAAVAQPDQRIGDLAILPETERKQLLFDWNATSGQLPELPLQQLFERQAQHSPDAVAVRFDTSQPNDPRGPAEETALTYAELNQRANQLAERLRELGVGPETRVAVCMTRSLELVIGLLGILKVGGAYLPLDPGYPAERLAFMLEDSQPQVLLTATTDHRPTTEDGQGGKGKRGQGDNDESPHVHPPSSILHSPSSAWLVVDLIADWPVIDRQPAANPDSRPLPDHPVYVIYTSGSTGKPKGAVNTHRAAVNRLLWMQGRYQLTPDDQVLQKTPFSFDVSVWEFFWPLIAGATLVVARPEGHKDNQYLARLIAAQQITTLHFVPSMLRLFLETPGLAGCRSLRRVFCSGEALSSELAACFFGRLAAELHNLYGPTEAAVDVTAWACRCEEHRPGVPIGRPIANTQVYLLDRQLQPVPVGVPGELYIGGVQLARGYLNRPDLTAERFVPNPFPKVEDRGLKIEDSVADAPEMLSSILYPLSSNRLYRTGDLARYLPDGAIEFLGRIDRQIKLRGFRVEPEEIAAVLAQHPAVQEALVVAREDQPGELRLVAYVVPKIEDRGLKIEDSIESASDPLSSILYPLSSELRGFLKTKLPDYMIPAAFVLLDALPLMPNGKLDRRVLPAPDGTRPAPEASYVAPADELELRIAAIWQTVLGVERIGVHDNFFDLGGHSLLLIQVHAALQTELQRELAVVELFQYPTVSALARHLRQGPPEPSAAQTRQTRAETRLDRMNQQRQFRQRSRSGKERS